jgi:hypothetical protein
LACQSNTRLCERTPSSLFRLQTITDKMATSGPSTILTTPAVHMTHGIHDGTAHVVNRMEQQGYVGAASYGSNDGANS